MSRPLCGGRAEKKRNRAECEKSSRKCMHGKRTRPGPLREKREKTGRQAARPLPADTPPAGEGVFAETAGPRPGGEEEPRVDAKRPA